MRGWIERAIAQITHEFMLERWFMKDFKRNNKDLGASVYIKKELKCSYD